MRISSEIKTEDWQEFVSNHPDGNAFQTPGMYDFFATVKRFSPLAIGAFDENNELCSILTGLFIREKEGIGKLLSCRFVIYGGPLIKGDEEQKRHCLDLLLGELVKQTGKKALFIQFRNYFSWEGYIDVFEKHGFTLLDRLNYIVRLREARDRRPATGDRKPESKDLRITNEEPATSNRQPVTISRESILFTLSATRRRQIRKGLASGAEIIEPENVEQVREFYDILYKLYRYKVRKPLADWSFFESFYNQSAPRTTNREPHTGIGIIRLIRFN
ncbi:MAG: hypothetical protein V2I47_05500, partial [Bacteroidales bacterium]|nr:hypothetical protein [Bacteroidales bacterium]